MPSNFTRTPLAGPLRVTTPLRANPFTQIFPLGTHKPIATFAPGLTGVAVSTRQPPTLVLERFPQIGVGTSSTRNSTATKHLIRGCLLRSLPQFGLKMSGSNGGVADAGVGTAFGSKPLTPTAAALASPLAAADSALIWRIASIKADSRFSGAASR